MSQNPSSGAATKPRFVRSADLILIAALLVLGLSIFLPRTLSKADGNVTAVIVQNGKTIQTIDLRTVEEPYTISLDCHPAVVLAVEPGSIRYQSAACKDKICVRTGTLSKPGDTAACLPSRTLVRLESRGAAQNGDGPDTISY